MDGLEKEANNRIREAYADVAKMGSMYIELCKKVGISVEDIEKFREYVDGLAVEKVQSVVF